jgi:hypothetical protein
MDMGRANPAASPTTAVRRNGMKRDKKPKKVWKLIFLEKALNKY